MAGSMAKDGNEWGPERLNLGIVGAGNIATRHLANLEFLGGNRIAGICDVDMRLAGRKAAAYGAGAYDQWRHMLDDNEDLDGVFICTPPTLRRPIIEEAVARKLPFLCEKPPAQSLDEARAIVSLLRGANLIHSVGFNQRYAPSVDHCLELFRGRQVNLVEATVIGNAALTRGLGADWFYLKEQGGGLFDNSVHTIDAIRYIAGEVVSVQAFGSNLTVPKSDEFTIEDSLSINLQFEHGAVGCILLSWACAQGRNSLTIFGRDIRLSVSTIPPSIEGMVGQPGAPARPLSETFPQGPAMGRSGQIHPDRKPEDPPDPPHYDEVKVFLDALRSGSMAGIRSDFADASRTMALLHAIESSVISGQVERVEGIV